MKSRTLCGDGDAEARIAGDLRRIGRALEDTLGGDLRALLLVGGYARHEGSAVERDGELGPYNDYDFIAVVGRPGNIAARLREFSREWSARVGVDVDLWPLERNGLGSVPTTLFWLDIALGGVELVVGDSSVLNELRAIESRQVPLDEVGRLLANRAVGIALSNLEAIDRDLRRIRHGHKAVLACGDARLFAAGCYRPNLAARLQELERLAPTPAIGIDLVAAYRDAVAFRVRPDLWRPKTGTVAAWYEDIRARVGRWHLAFECWRTGCPDDPERFARWTGRLYERLPDVRRGAAALSAVRAHVQGVAPLLPYHGHVRERLARVAVALAYGDERARSVAARLLGAPASAADDELHRRLERLTERGG